MSFKIQLYTNTSPENSLDKNLNAIDDNVVGVLKEGTSLIDPIFQISIVSLDLFKNCNYVIIPSFGRNYFVKNIDTTTTHNVIELNCHVDVLTTYRDTIRKNNAILKRSENTFNLYLNDNKFMTKQNPKFAAIPFGYSDNYSSNPLSNHYYVLTIAGGPFNNVPVVDL